MKKLISVLFFILFALYPTAVRAQGPAGGLPVNQVAFPAPFPTRQLFFYDGNNQLQYVCTALDIQSVTSFSVAGTTLTNIVVATNVGTVTIPGGHNLYVGARVQVINSLTAALNAVYTVKTTPSSTTFTITTSGVADGTYNNAPLTVSTSNPLSNAAVWSIQVLINTGPNNTIVDSHYAIPTVGLNQNASTPMTLACSNRASF